MKASALLLMLMFLLVSSSTIATAQEPADQIQIKVKNDFALVKVSIFADGQYCGDVGPLQTNIIFVNQGALLLFQPELATSTSINANGSGTYRVYPTSFGGPTAVEYTEG